MNRRWRTVAVLVAGLLYGLGAPACSSGSGGGSGGSPADGGASDASHPRDGAVEDHTAVEASSPDAAVEASSVEAGADGGVTCAPPTAKGTACAACVQSNCEQAWCTCSSDPANIDDAGNSGCVRYVACAEQCVATDAGTPTDCLQKICAGVPLSPIEENEGQTLVDCLVAYCDSECVD